MNASNNAHGESGSRLARFADALAARLGDPAVPAKADATELALERTYMASERTLQAWIRTALSLISFGFTIGKLGQIVVTLPGMPRIVGTDSLAYMLVTLGTTALGLAAFQHWLALRSMRARGLHRRPSLAFGVALLLTMLGGFAFSALVMKL